MTTATQSPSDRTVLLRLSSALRIDRDPDCLFGQLHDPELLFDCVPGVSLTRVLDPRTVEARMVIGLGPFTAAYIGSARIVRSDGSLRTTSIDLEGQSDIWGSARAHLKLTVRPAVGGSSLRTSVWLAMTGRSTLLGRPILHRVAGEMFARTEDRMKSRLEDEVLTSS
jgi:carbon monoxide dehydrogenase subunit G